MITQHTPLGEVVAVLPGYALKGRVEPASDGRYQLIQGRHLTPGEPYRYAPEHRLRITPQRPAEPYRVRPGDVLLASRGNLNYAVALLAVPEPTIAPATFYILRPGPRVDPAYLAWVLEQPPVQAQMAQVRTTGAATPILQRADFKAVRIPLPPLARIRLRELLRHRRLPPRRPRPSPGIQPQARLPPPPRRLVRPILPSPRGRPAHLNC